MSIKDYRLICARAQPLHGYACNLKSQVLYVQLCALAGGGCLSRMQRMAGQWRALHSVLQEQCTQAPHPPAIQTCNLFDTICLMSSVCNLYPPDLGHWVLQAVAALPWHLVLPSSSTATPPSLHMRSSCTAPSSQQPSHRPQQHHRKHSQPHRLHQQQQMARLALEVVTMAVALVMVAVVVFQWVVCLARWRCYALCSVRRCSVHPQWWCWTTWTCSAPHPP